MRQDQTQSIIGPLTDEVSLLQAGNQLLQSQKQTLEQQGENLKQEISDIKYTGSMQLEEMRLEVEKAKTASAGLSKCT